MQKLQSDMVWPVAGQNNFKSDSLEPRNRLETNKLTDTATTPTSNLSCFDQGALG